MKRMMAILVSAVLVFSLAGCSATPSDEEIKEALADGRITVEDATSRGWIDEAWIQANYQPIEAKSKIYLFEPFETTYLDGTPASSTIIEGTMCLVFFNTERPDTLEKLKAYHEVSDQMKELGVPILGILTDKDVAAAKERLSHISFPVIVYNEAMLDAFEGDDELIQQDVVSVFTKDGGFYSAWSSGETAESLLDYAKEEANET